MDSAPHGSAAIRANRSSTKLDVDAADSSAVPFDEVRQKHAQQLVRRVAALCNHASRQHPRTGVPFDVDCAMKSMPPDFCPPRHPHRVFELTHVEHFMRSF